MNKPSQKKFWITALALLALVLFLDQYTKELIDKHLPIEEVTFERDGKRYVGTRYLARQEIEIIPKIFYVVHVVNKGAAWGIFHGRTNLLSLISLVAVVGMAVFFSRICEGFYERSIALGLLMGGTLGNLVDRMGLVERRSAIRGVVDFISFQYKPMKWEYPSFNIADSAICVGVAILMISMFLRPDKNGERAPFAEKIVKRWHAFRNNPTPSANEAS